jgi:hypothetical protein
VLPVEPLLLPGSLVRRRGAAPRAAGRLPARPGGGLKLAATASTAPSSSTGSTWTTVRNAKQADDVLDLDFADPFWSYRIEEDADLDEGESVGIVKYGMGSGPEMTRSPNCSRTSQRTLGDSTARRHG